MFNLFLALFNWVSQLWDKLPKEAKEAIINAIVDSFDEIIRGFYRKSKSS